MVAVHERELRAFVSIVELGRMDLTAAQLGYSQPAVSYQIKCLERSLGVRLLDRNCTGTRITEAGQMVLPTAKAILVLLETIRAVGGGHRSPKPDLSVVG